METRVQGHGADVGAKIGQTNQLAWFLGIIDKHRDGLVLGTVSHVL